MKTKIKREELIKQLYQIDDAIGASEDACLAEAVDAHNAIALLIFTLEEMEETDDGNN